MDVTYLEVTAEDLEWARQDLGGRPSSERVQALAESRAITLAQEQGLRVLRTIDVCLPWIVHAWGDGVTVVGRFPTEGAAGRAIESRTAVGTEFTITNLLDPDSPFVVLR